MSDQIQRLGGSINAVVVQLPERREPGVVVQRDSMLNLLALVSDAKSKLLANDWDEVRDLVDELEEQIKSYADAMSGK